MRYRKGFKTSLITVLLVIGLGMVFSLVSYKGPSKGDVILPPLTDGQIAILKKYLTCTPYIGYDKKYEVWRREASMAIEFGSVSPVYRAKILAQSLASQMNMLPTDKDLLAFATVLILRSDLINWYRDHLDKDAMIVFQKTHVGFLQWREGGKCIDYSFLPLSRLPIEYRHIDITYTWDEAMRRGLVIEGYVEGIFTEKVLWSVP